MKNPGKKRLRHHMAYEESHVADLARLRKHGASRLSHFTFIHKPKKLRLRIMADTEMNDDTAPSQARAGAILDARPTFFNNGYGFPDRYITRIRYCSAITLSSTSGSIGKQTWNMNSIFDPDSTGAGHQPLWHDTLIGIYNHYSVTSATLRVRFIATHATMPFIVGLIGDDDGTTSSTYETLMESNHAISDELSPYQEVIHQRS